jgi:enoyl-CoA hydratase/carnithine racemase
MADDVVLYERRGAVALVTLNRPDRLNAWNGELEERYFDLLDEAAADPNIRAIVVTGAGRGFCAGADMDMLQGIGNDSSGSAARRTTTRPRQQWYTTTVPKPVIAAINGACAGIGLVQALMCDLRFAAAGAKFTTAFVRRGLVAEHGISWMLPKVVGPARALDLLFSGRVFLAEEAAELGVVNEVVAPEALLDRVFEYANDLVTNSSPSAMAVMKQQVYADYSIGLEEATNRSYPLMAASLTAEDFREGVRSFLEKRPPNFAPIGVQGQVAQEAATPG